MNTTTADHRAHKPIATALLGIRTITAAALAAGILFQAQGFAQEAVRSGTSAAPAPAAADPEAAARESWRSFVAKNPPPEKGCFHVSYPNFVWESVDCKETQTRVHPVRVNPPAGAPLVVGDGNDYAAAAQGLISNVEGYFIATGVTSVTSVGVASFDNAGILGPNEYSLQLNTNADSTTSACAGGKSTCTVWQQFVYATDYNTKGEAALFMQYWLLDWGSCHPVIGGNIGCSPCPKGWKTYPNHGEADCYKNSKSVPLPDIPITSLGDVIINTSATPGGNDGLMLSYGTDGGFESWFVSAEDSVLLGGVDIGSVWQEAEYNVVGDAGGSEAEFNYGSSITVRLNLIDGSNFAPACFSQAGTTGETNNLDLGTCQAAAFFGPYIEFTESLLLHATF
jgi:hypothetical protein